MPVLAATPVKRVFTYEDKNGNEIDLKDFNPQATPEEIIKFYSGTYPELTNAKIEAPEFKGEDMHFNVSVGVGTKG